VCERERERERERRDFEGGVRAYFKALLLLLSSSSSRHSLGEIQENHEKPEVIR
jgi:hypothetical protein